MTSTAARELLAAGRPVATCPECGRAFDPGVDYAGRRGAPDRATCSSSCRKARRNRRATDLRRHRHATASIAAMHALEDAGQLAIGDPLPEIPDAPPLDPADS